MNQNDDYTPNASNQTHDDIMQAVWGFIGLYAGAE